MSKNFELLHNISNEKGLFQTLDDWEGVDQASLNAEGEAAFEGQPRVGAQQLSPLPDVFQAVDNTLGSFELATPDLSREIAPVQRSINEPLTESAHTETQSTNLEGSMRISRNPLTRLSSELDIPPAWVKREIVPGPNDKIELELGPEALPSSAFPESQQIPDGAASFSATKVQEPGPAQEEKLRHEPLREPAFRNIRADEGKSIGNSRGRTARERGAYKDPRREAIAHEEELKLVQRIFLAEGSSPQMALFSGFERDTGCASICIHAAEILAAQTEGSVCLVDMGLRVPSLHEYCGVKNERGLAEALAESNPIQEFAQQLSPANLWVIPSGRGAAQLNFAKVADRLRTRMEELRKAFRFIVIHSGSLWLNADAMLISKWTDGVVLILEAHSTRRDTARRIKESLGAANARVLGVVLNNRTYPIPDALYSRL